MSLAAYILLADAAWIEPSVLSYYDAVDKIVASYDEEHLGWSGVPLPVDRCIQRLKAIDRDGKIVWLPGTYRARPGRHLMQEETAQRQDALDLASEGADWVLQFDTDEVVSDLGAVIGAIGSADRAGASGLEYAARHLNVRVSKRWYLENAQRDGRTWPAIPGAIAVKQGGRLKWARQIDGDSARCSWRQGDSTVPAIAKRQALVHLSRVRTAEAMVWKSTSSGHVAEVDWSTRLAEWRSATQHPLRAMTLSHLRRGRERQRFARINLDLDPVYLPTGVEDW